MKRLFLFALLAVMVGANALFAAVNYKEVLLTPNATSRQGDSTRAQATVGKNALDIYGTKDLNGKFQYPGLLRFQAVVSTGDTDCDSTTILWLSSNDSSFATYITRDSLELQGNTAGQRILFSANIEDSVYRYNIFLARPQCDDAAAAAIGFKSYLYYYNGIGELYYIRNWGPVMMKQAAGGGI